MVLLAPRRRLFVAGEEVVLRPVVKQILAEDGAWWREMGQLGSWLTEMRH